MKRLLSLISIIVCAAGQMMAGGFVASTTPLDGKPEHVYTLMNGNGVYCNPMTAPTQTEANYGTFAFYAVEGVADAYHIYSTKAQKWLTYTPAASYNNGKDFVKMSDTQVEDAYFKITAMTNGNYEIRPITTSGTADKYLNWFQGLNGNPLDGTNTLGLWQDNGSSDAGSRWTFNEVIITEHTYTINLPEGATIKIGDKTYSNGDTYSTEGSVKREDITAIAPEGTFAVVVINDETETITVDYVNVPTLPTCAAYTNAVVYPAQQEAVGAAKLQEANGVYTFNNNVLAAAFIKVGNALFFGGSETMNLEAGTEIFSVAFGSGTTVYASAMTLKSIEMQDLEAKVTAIGGAEHFAGKALVANYEYTYNESKIEIVWRAVLRDGSHYLRTEMELKGIDDVDMYNVIPLAYNVDTKAAGSTPEVVGNTRGAIIMSNKIFAGLEHPVAYNTVGGATGEEDLWELTTTMDEVKLTATSWQQVAEGEVPGRVTETTGANYPNVFAYEQTGVALRAGQKVEVKVEYTSGNNRLNFAGADLLDSNGSIAANDYHKGFTGNAFENNTFTFIAPNDGTFSIRVMVENKTEPITASSKLTTKIYTLKEGAVIKADLVSIQGRWSRNTTLAAGETWKIAGVVGLVAQDGTEADANIHNTQKRRSFLAYSERERAVPWRAYPVYISWYELNIDRNNAADPTQNMNAEQVMNVLDNWEDAFHNRYGVGPKSFVIDDGWDNYGTWTFHAGFPNEMRDMAAAAAEMKAGVGAWLGPVGGYGTSGNYRRAYWNKDNRGGMQLSNPAYYQVFKDAAYNLTKNQGDFNFFKFDGISGQFSATGPDNGDTGNENAEGIIRLERYVREELREDIFFNTTVGTWASPFWFQFTDAVWRQENDYGTIGNNSIDRENWITYRDRLVYQNFVQNSPICPINTLMTHGFILTSHGNVSKNMDYDAARRELRCAFVCGSGMVELYNDYTLMNSINGGKLWTDLAECIKWQKRNADVLPDAHWVGGNPWDGSNANVYGWASWNGTKSTLALRNGSNNAQTYSFTLREALNIPANVSGSIILRSSFGEQAALEGLEEGKAINIDETLSVSLPGSSLYVFDGIDATATIKTVESIALTAEAEDNTVEASKTLVVLATINPEAATFPALAWESSNPEVATVSEGLVKALKEGTTTIKATAKDGSQTTASITITVIPKVPEPLQPYATNFDKDASATRTDRYINSITFTEEGKDAQTISVGVAKPYLDKSADESCLLTCTAGSTVKVDFSITGHWMNGYVFIDTDNDQQFSFNEGTTDQSGTEVMTFSFYTGNFNDDTNGVNSAGESFTGQNRNTTACPSFIAPATKGDYRIRFKLDWNSIDPGGQIAADGTCNGTNGFLANGGSIVDATLRVTEPSGIESVETESGKTIIYDLQGRKLNGIPAQGIYIKNGNKHFVK